MSFRNPKDQHLTLEELEAKVLEMTAPIWRNYRITSEGVGPGDSLLQCISALVLKIALCDFYPLVRYELRYRHGAFPEVVAMLYMYVYRRLCEFRQFFDRKVL